MSYKPSYKVLDLKKENWMMKYRQMYIYGDIVVSKKFTLEVLEWLTKQKKEWHLRLKIQYGRYMDTRVFFVLSNSELQLSPGTSLFPIVTLI